MDSTNPYKNGDYVLVNDLLSSKNKIGKIEEIMENEQEFTYCVYFRPEDTICGRLPHHGKNEIFKSTLVEKEKVANIVTKCSVHKLTIYIKLNTEEKQNDTTFIFRQMYDPFTKKFTPDLEPECFCKKIINPDEEVFKCDYCENKFYHYACIVRENNQCLNCSQNLLEEEHEIFKKRKLEDNTILLKVDRDKYMDSINKTLELMSQPSADYQMPRVNTHEPNPLLPLGKQLSQHQEKPKRPLPNISDEAYKKVTSAIETFGKTNSIRNMPEHEKQRHKAKEIYYKCMLYGYEELKDFYRRKSQYSSATESEKKLLLKDETAAYSHCQVQAYNIESAVWAKVGGPNARLKNKDMNYPQKNRMLFRYLQDDNNYELRLKVLLGEKTPNELVEAEESELAPMAVNRLIHAREEQLKKESLLTEEARLISKSHKGETIIEAPSVVMQETQKYSPDDMEEEHVYTKNNRIEEEFPDMPDYMDEPGPMRHKSVDKPTPSNTQQSRKLNGANDTSSHSTSKMTKNLSQNKAEQHVSASGSQNSDSNKLQSNKSNLVRNKSIDESASASSNPLTKNIDQELYKKLKEHTVEKTYHLLTNRIREMRKDISDHLLKKAEYTVSKF
jgi:hypothetical protein